MEFIEALLTLSDKHGTTPVVVFVVIIGGGFMIRGVISVWNKVRLSNADGRNKIETSTSSAIQQLADSNRELAAQLSAMVSQNNATLQAAQAGSLEQSKQFNKSLDRMDGMLEVMNDNKKMQRGMSTTISDVADRIAPMQTDLKDISLRTVGLPSTFTTLLDERLTPMLTLIIGMNTQVNALASLAQSGNTNVESVIAEIAVINDRFSKVIDELKLFKDLFFDRDDRIATILNKFTTKEIVPS